MNLYRICTEGGAENEERALYLVSQYFPGYTVLRGKGFWKGTREKSLVIEIAADAIDADKVRNMADEIRAVNQQDSVCIQTLTCEVHQCTG